MSDPVENSVDYVNNSPKMPTAPLTWRDAAAPLLALILACLFWTVFVVWEVGYYGPGAGVPAFVACYFGAVCLMLGKRARYSLDSVFLMAVSMALAMSCWLYTNLGLSVLNCFIILVTAAGATFRLSGQSRFSLRDARIIPETVRLSFLALFSKISHPFRLLGQLKKPGKRAFGRAALSLLLCIPLLAVVIALLSSADEAFGNFFKALIDRLTAPALRTPIWKIINTVLLALFIASGLYFLRMDAPAPPSADAPAKERHALSWFLPAVLLNLVYLLYCGIQVWGGSFAAIIYAAAEDNIAQYAREGFFQLVAVAAINLTFCLLAAHKDRFAAKGGLALRIANGLMLLLTLVILADAILRMYFYIRAYGLTLLRLMTLWGMLVILAGILAAGWKLFRPQFSFFRIFAPFVLTAWCLFCLATPGGIIANYNVDHYLSGDLETVDTFYLERLGTDALPALYRLNEATGEGEYAIEAAARHAEYRSAWHQHKLSYRFLPED